MTRDINDWRVANNGTGPRIWFVTRGGYVHGFPREDHVSESGTLIRYATWGAAQKVADRLNNDNS